MLLFWMTSIELMPAYEEPSAMVRVSSRRRRRLDRRPVRPMATDAGKPRSARSLRLLGHARELVLAERGLVFHAQALPPFPGEVALEPPVDDPGDAHREERPEARQRHVLVRIPLVALRAEIGLAQIAADDHDRGPLAP